MAMYLTPKETLEYVKEAAVKKTTRSKVQMLILAIFAGASIAFGATGSVLASGGLAKIDYGLAKFLAGVVFPVGLIFVILCQLELFTSNCLMIVGVVDKKIELKNMIQTLCLVWIGNLIGSLIISFITFKTGTLNHAAKDFLLHANEARIHASTIDILLKAILANILVAAGAFSAYAAKDFSGKILTCWFFILLFTILGYDHSIANMTYLPTSLFLGGNLSIMLVIHNIVIATIGNFIGGAIVGLGMYYTHGK